MVEQVTEWVVQFWYLIAPVLLLLNKLINAKTEHWRSWPWYGKAFGFIIELLDQWRPPDLTGSKALSAKVKQAQYGEKTIGGILLALMFLPACAGWQQNLNTGLLMAHQVGVAAREVATPYIEQACIEKADECTAAGLETCDPLKECDALWKTFNRALETFQASIKTVQDVIDKLRELGIIDEHKK